MKKYKIEFLGNEEKCLENFPYTTADERVKKCNEFIQFIAENDRHFFLNKENNFVARFETFGDKLAFIDHYTQKPIFKTHKQDKYKWKGDFNGGGTLQDLVSYMSIFIKSGIPFFPWFARISNWGYSEDKAKEIEDLGFKLGIFANEQRFMFYKRSDSNLVKIREYLDFHKEIQKDKCIIVHADSGADKPYWVGEFNFIYTYYK